MTPPASKNRKMKVSALTFSANDDGVAGNSVAVIGTRCEGLVGGGVVSQNKLR